MRFAWANISERRILALRAIAFVNFKRWIGFCTSELFRKIDFGGSMSWKTQPNCRAFDDQRLVRPSYNSCQVSRLISGRPDLPGLWPRLTTGCHTSSCQSFFFNMATALLSSFFWDLFPSCSSTWRCAYEHCSSNLQPLLVSQNKHSGGCHFHKMNWCKILFGNPCMAIETFYHWDSYIWDFGFSTHFTHSAAWKISETYSTVSFSTLINVVAETAIVSL